MSGCFTIFVLFLFAHKVVSVKEEDLTKKYDNKFIFYAEADQSPYFDRLDEAENMALQISCGYRPARMLTKNTPRMMVNFGEFVSQGDFPWTASLSASTDSSLPNRCGATIISQRHLLSATHCFFNYEEKSIPCGGPSLKDDFEHLKISFGGACLRRDTSYYCNEKDVQTIKVKKVAIFEAFNDQACTGGGDIAIIELAEDIKFDQNTQPICIMGITNTNNLLRKMDLLKRVSDIESAGWGIDQSGAFPARMRRLTAEINEQYDISSYFSGDGDDVIRLIGKFPNSENKYANICSGDSGGGTIGVDSKTGRYVIVGIHSYSGNCDEASEQTEYSVTMVNSHVERICYVTGVCPPGILIDEDSVRYQSNITVNQ